MNSRASDLVAVCIYVTKEQKRGLLEEARRSGRTLSNLIRIRLGVAPAQKGKRILASERSCEPPTAERGRRIR